MFRQPARQFRLWWPLAAALIVGAGSSMGASQAGKSAAPSNVTKGCIDKFDASKDYFPDKVTIEDAAKFDVVYHRSYKVVSVRAGTASPAERYVLVQCGAPSPKLEGDLVGAQVATVPISSLYSASTTHLPLLVDLRRLDVLTGVSQMKYLTGDEILKRAASGQVREFAPISTIDAELVVSQRPGVLMTGWRDQCRTWRHSQRRDSRRRQQRMARADGARASGVAEVHGALSERGARRSTAI